LVRIEVETSLCVLHCCCCCCIHGGFEFHIVQDLNLAF
jgi:hypothetical protein